jgi:type IV pilus assembly protein PilW
MVSITTGLVILAALVALLVNTSRSNRELARMDGVIENGRLTIQLLEHDVAHAGFWGSFVPEYDDQTTDLVPTDVPATVPDPCLAYDTADWDEEYQHGLIALPVQVYDDATVCGGVITDRAAGTDVLVVRHVDTCVPGDGGACPDDIAGALYFQASQCAGEIPRYVLGTADFLRLERDCATPADKRMFVSDIYYVRDHAATAGDGIPTLMRSQFEFAGGTLAQRAPVAMIEGIEGFQVELGIDDQSDTGDAVDYGAAVQWADPDTRTSPTNRGDGVPDGEYVRCTTADPCTVAQLMNVTAVRIHALVRSRDDSPGYTDTKTYTLGSTTVGPFGDHFKRHVFMTTVRLPNIAGRRETP